MLGKLTSWARTAASRFRARPRQGTDPKAFSPGAFAFPPMRPLRPPPAQNDDLMQPVYEAVERELRSAGLLR
ncbi:hypothetical protein [Methylobacterium nigriterrae]|uniref:hypothetical protein n=1 Tax=Methylobacterium nigriterrae TaxID=3127512 RepID=UPI00301331DB